MTKALETALEKTKGLGPSAQDRLAQLIEDFTASQKDAASLAEDLRDPDYRAVVEAALKQGETDLADGRAFSADEILNRSRQRRSHRNG